MKRLLSSTLWVATAALFVYLVFRSSLYLGGMRMYHADECRNVFMARVLATEQAGSAFTSASVFLMPFAWLARDATRAVDLLVSARSLSLLLFWLNLILLVLATGERLLSRRGFAALVGAASLAPLWDFGFEIRHENLMLSGLLLTWYALRFHPARWQPFAIAGAIAVGLQFVTWEAFIYSLPLAMVVLIFPQASLTKVSRWRLGLAWILGGAGMLLLMRLTYGMAGIWTVWVAGFHEGVLAFWGRDGPASWHTFSRLLTQTPLLLTFAMASLVAAALDVRRSGTTVWRWEGAMPEAAWFACTLLVFIVNPAVQPKSAVLMIPIAFLAAFRYGAPWVAGAWDIRAARPLVVTLLVFAHVVPFGIATRRHFQRPNQRQEHLMRLAEDFTDPAKDRVYDGIGMVPTRRSIHFRWFLDRLNFAQDNADPPFAVRHLMAAQPPAVIILSHRTDRLSRADQAFIRQRYVSLSDDFMVLGHTLSRGSGSFEVVHPGRYQISALKHSSLLGTYSEDFGAMFKAAQTANEIPPFNGTLDGARVPGKPVELEAGTHRVESADGDAVAVVWVGPQMDRVPRIGREDHLRLFVNAY